MTELQKYKELCEVQAREIENYARIVNEIKYILDGATLKCQYVIELVDPLPELAEQEPVAWVSDSPTKGNGKQLHFTKADAWKWSSNITPLYTAPPKREWVDLTTEGINAVYIADRDNYFDDINYADFFMIARAIETKLKEKNHGQQY